MATLLVYHERSHAGEQRFERTRTAAFKQPAPPPDGHPYLPRRQALAFARQRYRAQPQISTHGLLDCVVRPTPHRALQSTVATHWDGLRWGRYGDRVGRCAPARLVPRLTRSRSMPRKLTIPPDAPDHLHAEIPAALEEYLAASKGGSTSDAAVAAVGRLFGPLGMLASPERPPVPFFSAAAAWAREVAGSPAATREGALRTAPYETALLALIWADALDPEAVGGAVATLARQAINDRAPASVPSGKHGVLWGSAEAFGLALAPRRPNAPDEWSRFGAGIHYMLVLLGPPHGHPYAAQRQAMEALLVRLADAYDVWRHDLTPKRKRAPLRPVETWRHAPTEDEVVLLSGCSVAAVRTMVPFVVARMKSHDVETSRAPTVSAALASPSASPARAR